MRFLSSSRPTWILMLTLLMSLLAGNSFAQDSHTTSEFHGVKVNGGTATHSKLGNKNVLTLSDDFKVPDTPDPHWQVVDSKGNVYPLDIVRLGICDILRRVEIRLRRRYDRRMV